MIFLAYCNSVEIFSDLYNNLLKRIEAVWPIDRDVDPFQAYFGLKNEYQCLINIFKTNLRFFGLLESTLLSTDFGPYLTMTEILEFCHKFWILTWFRNIYHIGRMNFLGYK